MSGAATGLAALGFWLFIAAVVVAGIWYDAKRKESQQETLRRVVESGRDIDPAMIDRVVGASDAKETERALKVAAYIVGGIAPGMFIMGLFLGLVDEDARMAIIGVSFLVGFLAVGLYVAAKYVERQLAGN